MAKRAPSPTSTARESSTVTTYVGKNGGEQKLRRFLVGPKECEITGIAETPDGKALFVNIQHPGESTAPNYRHRRVRQSLAGWRRVASALGDHRDHARRRRGDWRRIMGTLPVC